MRILIIRPTPDAMNINSYNCQEIGLAKAFIKKGHICDVAYYGGKEPDHIQEIKFDESNMLKIIWLTGFGLFHEGFYPTLHKYIHNYDIIQVGGYVGIVSCYLNRKVPNKVINYNGPYYCEENLGDIKRAKIWDRTLLPLQNKSNMIVISKSVLATEYIRNKGIKDVTTIGVGLDVDNLKEKNTASNNEFVNTINELKDEKLLLYVGVLEKRRNIPFLLEVFKKVNAIIPKSKLIIIGKGKQEYVSKCWDLIDEMKIRDKVIYNEYVDQHNLPQIYKACTAFLLPTRYEIFGMVLLEAMYYGLPVFSTYNGGSSTLIDESNGIIINSLDADIWRDKIVSIIRNTELCDSIRDAAHTTIMKNYTWDALANRFLDVYDKRLNK